MGEKPQELASEGVLKEMMKENVDEMTPNA